MRREARRDFGQAADQMGAIADRLSKRALDVTTPVYATSGNGKPRHQGSAVLLRLGEIRFLISAGHVLETISEQELSASACGVISPITGEVTYVCGSDTECPDGDPVDIRVVRLAGPEWDSVPLSRFLHWDELDHDPPVPKRHAFALIGFPHTKQRDTLKGTHITSRLRPTESSAWSARPLRTLAWTWTPKSISWSALKSAARGVRRECLRRQIFTEPAAVAFGGSEGTSATPSNRRD